MGPIRPFVVWSPVQSTGFSLSCSESRLQPVPFGVQISGRFLRLPSFNRLKPVLQARQAKAWTLNTLATLFALLALLAGCDRPPASSATTRPVKTLEFWQPFGGDVGEAMHKIVDEFHRTHPDIHVNVSYAANDLNSSQKLFLAIAGGCPPDVTMVDGQQLAEWAARGALTDITEHVTKAGLSGDDFWLPRWRESTFAGKVYALPWGADPNFILLWNKAAFAASAAELRAAGLDPDRPPKTIDELDQYNAILTKTDARGQVIQVGLIPWAWDGDNSMFTWGYSFGGDFYQTPPEGSGTLVGKVTANHPSNVAALKWMASYAKKYDVRRISAFRASFPGMANNPFYSGREAMRLFHVSEMTWLHRYAPTLDYGVAPIPAGREADQGWIGGWSCAIPRGAAASAEAFEFIRWMCTSPEGTMVLGKEMMQMPAYRKSPYFDTIKDDRDMAMFYKILSTSQHVRTLMPVQGYLMDQLRRGVTKALYENADPQQVLDTVTANAQQRLEHVMQRVQLRLDAAAAAKEAR